jgi:hypothetical protein
MARALALWPHRVDYSDPAGALTVFHLTPGEIVDVPDDLAEIWEEQLPDKIIVINMNEAGRTEADALEAYEMYEEGRQALLTETRKARDGAEAHEVSAEMVVVPGGRVAAGRRATKRQAAGRSRRAKAQLQQEAEARDAKVAEDAAEIVAAEKAAAETAAAETTGDASE